MSGVGPETVWRCRDCGTEVQFKLTLATVDVSVHPGCPVCHAFNTRIVEMDGIVIDDAERKEQQP